MLSEIRTTPLLRTAWLAAIALRLVQIGLAMCAGDSGSQVIETAQLALGASWTAIALASCAGLFELASQVATRGRRAARVAAYVSAAMLVAALGSAVARAAWYVSTDHGAAAFSVSGIVSIALSGAFPIALGVAAWFGASDRRHRALAVTLTILSLLGSAAIACGPKLLPASDLETFRTHLAILEALLAIAVTAMHLALAVMARPSLDAAPSPRLAARGLRAIAGSLWLRVAVTVVAALAMLQFASELFGGSSSRIYLELGLVVPGAVEIVLFGMLALGAFAVARGAIDGTPRRAFVIAGLGAGWCAGVLLQKAPYVVAFTSGAFADDSKLLDSFTIGEPIIAIATIAAIVFALRHVSAFASLADAASAHGLGFVVAMLASVALANAGAETAGSIAVSGLLALAAVVMAARVVSRAAGIVASQEPALPTATAISAPEA